MTVQGVAKEEKPPSFKNATYLQKLNQVLQQELQYFSAHPEHLEEEGLLRLAGNEVTLAPILKEIQADPTKKSLVDRKELTHDPHSAISILKKMLKQPVNLSENTVLQLKKLYEEDQNITINDIVNNIITAEHSSEEAQLIALEEAKLIHNLFHLSYLVAKNGDKNKMPASNVGLIVGPWLDNLTMGAKAMNPETFVQVLKMQEVLQPKFIRIVDGAIADSKSGNDPSLAQPFNKAYSAQAHILENDYRSKLGQEQKSSGNFITRFVNAFVRGIKNLFSWKSKAEKQDIKITSTESKAQTVSSHQSKAKSKAEDLSVGLDNETSLQIEANQASLKREVRKGNETRKVVSPQFEQAQNEAERKRLRNNSQEIIKELKEKQAKKKDQTTPKSKG